MNGFSLLEHLSVIKDYRQDWKISHSLSDILFLSIVAIIAGAEGWEDIADFGYDQVDWLKKYGDFENGTPSHHTIARVFASMNPKEFEKCFIAWMKACQKATKGDVIAIDGKTVRGSYTKSDKSNAIHMVSAFSAANEVVLGQVKTDIKSNESVPWALKPQNRIFCA